MSRRTSSRSTLTMVPSTMSPSLKYLIVWSMAARKSSSDPMSLIATWGLVDVGAVWVSMDIRWTAPGTWSDRACRDTTEVSRRPDACTGEPASRTGDEVSPPTAAEEDADRARPLTWTFIVTASDAARQSGHPARHPGVSQGADPACRGLA